MIVPRIKRSSNEARLMAVEQPGSGSKLETREEWSRLQPDSSKLIFKSENWPGDISHSWKVPQGIATW